MPDTPRYTTSDAGIPATSDEHSLTVGADAMIGAPASPRAVPMSVAAEDGSPPIACQHPEIRDPQRRERLHLPRVVNCQCDFRVHQRLLGDRPRRVTRARRLRRTIRQRIRALRQVQALERRLIRPHRRVERILLRLPSILLRRLRVGERPLRRLTVERRGVRPARLVQRALRRVHLVAGLHHHRVRIHCERLHVERRWRRQRCGGQFAVNA